MSNDKYDWSKGDGLIPTIVQDADDGRVLMLGYMNEDALAKTHDSQLVTFYSRSRQTLWTKGETSGNTLALESVHIDCDLDTLLVRARPAGPVCHTGTPTCFKDDPLPAVSFVGQLDRIIGNRANEPVEKSYTAKLLSKGVKRVAQKVGEEGVEVALAAVAGDRAEVTSEAADLVYHLLVLLRSADVPLRDVAKELERRHAGSR